MYNIRVRMSLQKHIHGAGTTNVVLINATNCLDLKLRSIQ